MEQGIIIVISGLSGSGKGTICKRLVEKYPNDYVISISSTDRKPREGEVDGREYFFLTPEDFEKKIEEGYFIENAKYVGHNYGTPKQWVKDQLAEDRNVILEIDIQGAFQVREQLEDVYLFFVLPPSLEELEKRLRNRGTETDEEIKLRMERAMEEVKFVPQYDFIIVNEIVENSVDLLHNYVQSIKFTKKSEMGDN